MSTNRTYLDYNATAPLCDDAADAMHEALRLGGNPSSVHAEGRTARSLIEAARQDIAAGIGAPSAAIVFTSGGTEANNLAIRGVVSGEGLAHIIVSGIEHPSVADTCHATGARVHQLAVDPDGTVRLADLERKLDELDGPALVSVMAANNETGALQPVDEVVRLAHERGALVHTDAVQALGKTTLDFAALGVDLLTLSSHKIGGPQGAGALAVKEGLKIAPQLTGGGQELRRRGGTENVSAIAGFAAAARAVPQLLAQQERVAGLRDRLEKVVLGRYEDGVAFAREAARLPNTSCVAIPDCDAEYLVIALDLEGFALSAGSACSSGKVGRSHVLEAMGVPGALSDCAIRVSLGCDTTGEEIDAFAEALLKVCARKREVAAHAAA